ncbi:MAG: hypothetical protein HY688_00940 [Chloroflexi bacterium]|nr:hypothetical protein [Chloroflexota bacterium]
MMESGMRQVVEGVLTARADRQRTLRATRENVRDALGQHRKARHAAAFQRRTAQRTHRAALAAGRAALKGETGSLRREMASAQGDGRRTRLTAAQVLRHTRHEGWKAQRATMRRRSSDLQRRRAAEAPRLSRQRLGTVQAIQQDTGTLRQRTRASLQESARARHLGRRALTHTLEMGREALRSRAVAERTAAARTRATTRAALARARAEWGRVGAHAPAASQPAAPTAAAPPPGEDLAQRSFAYLADHPDGVRLRDLEEILGANRFRMVEALRALIEGGKVRREEGLYFAR